MPSMRTRLFGAWPRLLGLIAVPWPAESCAIGHIADGDGTLPRHAASVRVVIRTDDGGQVGTVELDHETLAAAPESRSPDPQLMTRPKAAFPAAKP